MMMILEPGEFLMGSPITDKERWKGASGTNEALHRRRIDHRVAFSAHEVTVEQFMAFAKNHSYATQYSPTKKTSGQRYKVGMMQPCIAIG